MFYIQPITIVLHFHIKHLPKSNCYHLLLYTAQFYERKYLLFSVIKNTIICATVQCLFIKQLANRHCSPLLLHNPIVTLYFRTIPLFHSIVGQYPIATFLHNHIVTLYCRTIPLLPPIFSKSHCYTSPLLPSIVEQSHCSTLL